MEELKKSRMKSIKDKEWSIEDGLVLKEERIYVPEGALRAEVIWQHHNTAIGGHGRRWKTTELVGRNYWWLGMTKEVAKYMEAICAKGTRTKQRHQQASLCLTLYQKNPGGTLVPTS